MKRQISGLHAADRCAADQIPDGVFLVRVQRVKFLWQAQKPYCTLALAVLQPGRFADRILSSRLYCSPKALWKARAAMAGMSLSDYLLVEIKEIAERPTLAELRERLHQRKPVSVQLDTPRLVREERELR